MSHNPSVDGTLTIIYEPIEDGWWMATVAEYPGATSQGATQEEAKEMALSAMRDLIEARRARLLGEVGPDGSSESVRIAG